MGMKAAVVSEVMKEMRRVTRRGIQGTRTRSTQPPTGGTVQYSTVRGCMYMSTVTVDRYKDQVYIYSTVKHRSTVYSVLCIVGRENRALVYCN